MPYYVIFFIIALFSFLQINIRKEIELRLVYWIFAVILIIFAGIRYDTGYDFISYQVIFNEANLSNYPQYFIELGSAFLIVFVQSLNLPFAALLFLYAILSLTIKFNFFVRYSPYIFVSLLIYFPIGFLINEFGQIRHGLAIAIILIAFKFLFEGRDKLFFLFVFIATFFHFSAFIVFPAYFFVRRNYNSLYLIVSLVLLSSLLFFDSRPFFLLLLSYLPLGTMQGKITFYLYSEDFGKPLGFNLSIVLRLMVFFLLVYFKDIGEQRFHFYKKMTLLYYYGIVLYLIFNSISDFAIRSSLYFKTLDCIILPCIISFGKEMKEKNLMWMFVTLYALFSLYKPLSDPITGKDFTPYRTIFFKNN